MYATTTPLAFKVGRSVDRGGGELPLPVGAAVVVCSRGSEIGAEPRRTQESAPTWWQYYYPYRRAAHSWVDEQREVQQYSEAGRESHRGAHRTRVSRGGERYHSSTSTSAVFGLGMMRC